MKKYVKSIVAALLAVSLASPVMTVKAGEISGTITQETNEDGQEHSKSMSEGADEGITASDKPYLSLGADLTEEQKATVVSLMNVDATKLDQYDVVYVTNAEEHSYLDSYIASSEIGSKSLSSVVVVQKEKGSGLNISTRNISYCTEGMYQNACATAGITDADIIVAGPSSISGTAALVGIFKAYSEMTGKEIPAEVIDGALNELVVTGRLENSASNVDAADMEKMIAALKQEMVEQGLDDPEGIRNAVDTACSKYDISLTDDEKDQIVNLMMKLSTLNLDSDTLKKAENVLNQITSSVDEQDIEKAKGFLAGLWQAIKEFFKSLFA